MKPTFSQRTIFRQMVVEAFKKIGIEVIVGDGYNEIDSIEGYSIFVKPHSGVATMDTAPDYTIVPLDEDLCANWIYMYGVGSAGTYEEPPYYELLEGKETYKSPIAALKALVEFILCTDLAYMETEFNIRVSELEEKETING